MASQTGLVDYIKRGAHADFSEGVVLSKLAAGELIRVTPRDGTWTSYGTGATIAVGQGETSSFENAEQGIAFGWSISVPGALNNVGVLRFLFHGRVCGVRWQTNSNLSGTIPLEFAIDGRVYSGPDPRYRFFDSTSANSIVNEWLHMIDDDIPPTSDGRPHTLDIIGTADVAGSTTQANRIYGLLLERRAGYTETPRMAMPISTAAVPTSLTAIPRIQSGATSDRTLRGIRSIVYSNTAGTATKITISDNAVQAYELNLAASGTAGSSGVFDPAVPIQINGNWKHIASQAGANFTVMGAF